MRGSLALGILAPLVLAVPLGAQGPVIDHAPRACVVAERFPRLEARIADPDAVSRARVHFRGEAGTAWYYVEMKREGPVFSGARDGAPGVLRSSVTRDGAAVGCVFSADTPRPPLSFQVQFTIAASGDTCR